MGRLFGTDGIRGIAGKELTAGTAYRLGRAVAQLLKEKGEPRPCVLIGRDTRCSGPMLSSAIAAGLMSGGADAMEVGITATPAIAFLVKELNASAGVMISASHNSAEYNGLKVFGSDGYKLSDEDEARVESMILGEEPMIYALHGAIGVQRSGEDCNEKYISHVTSILCENVGEGTKSNRRILFDLSCGSAVATAKRIFTPNRLCGMQVDFVYDSADGEKINDGCGSTHIERLAKDVVSGGYDMGFAFDGDADRCLAVDEKGSILDGDILIAHLAKDRRARTDRLLAVVTVMTNLAFHQFCQREGIEVAVTNVGDRYVLREMLRIGAHVGGEQSGHIIFPEYATTGDGQVTAAVVLGLLARAADKSASEVFGEMKPLPQVTKNVKITRESRDAIMEAPLLAKVTDRVRKTLGENGRVLIRPSGTEALIRVMLEGQDQKEIDRLAGEIAETIVELCGVQ